MGGTERRSTAASSRRSAAGGYQKPKKAGCAFERCWTGAIPCSLWTLYADSAKVTSGAIYTASVRRIKRRIRPADVCTTKGFWEILLSKL